MVRVRAWVMAVVGACSESSAPPTAVPRGAGDAIAEDASSAPADAAAAPAPETRAPGIYPVLVLHRIDAKPHAYILACAQIQTGERAAFLAPAACAKIIGTPRVEVVGKRGARTPVTLGGEGKGFPCPGGDGPDQPWLAVAGLPGKHSRTQLVIPAGLAVEHDRVDATVMAAIRREHRFASMPGPRGRKASTMSVIGAIDLDGDGVLEVITENLGSVRLFGSDGQLIGEVGCEFG